MDYEDQLNEQQDQDRDLDQDLDQDQYLQGDQQQSRSGGYRRDDDRRRPRRADGEFGPLEVSVVEGNVEGAIRVLKRKLSKEGVLKQLKLKRFHEKPSVRRKRKRKEAERRRRRQMRRLAKRSTRPRAAGQ